MQKRINWKPGTMLYPIPVVLVSCGIAKETQNLITVAWCGTVCTNPPMLYISLKPERYSYDIIKKSMEFVVNIPSKQFSRIVDFCGVKSGREVNKWEHFKLAQAPSSVISTPQIDLCPIRIECKVKQILPLGSHDMFLAEVVNVAVLQNLIDKKGYLDLKRADLIAFSHGAYTSLSTEIGRFGFSVKKNRKYPSFLL